MRRGGFGRARWAVLGLGLTAALLLTACSPDDLIGVKLSERGAPVLTNCGTFFMGVKVYDADTTRLVWAAEPSLGSSENGAAEIVVGILPESDWTATAAFQPNPVPSNWRFVIDRSWYDEPFTFSVAGSALSVDQVFIPESGKTVPADTFIGETCGYDPPVPRAVQRTIALAFAVASVVVVGAVLVVRKVHHRRRKSV